MQLVDLDQNTLAWLEERKKYLGGSDIPSVMCVSPWRTPHQLWEEKLAICTPDHASKAWIFWRGHQFENIARQSMELRIGFDIPAQVVDCSIRPYARVSLDCLNVAEGFVGEVKFMGKASWLDLRENGTVPHHYWPQVQYQLMCTGLDELHFIGINAEKQIARSIVNPDIEYIKKMIHWCDHFWRLKESMTPPKLFQQDYKFLSRKQCKKDLNRIFRIDQNIGKLLDERARLQKSCLKAARSTRMAFERKIMINVSDFDHEDLSLITELKNEPLDHLARSIKDDIKLIVIKNKDKTIKGASHGKVKRKRKSKPKSKPKPKSK